MKKYPPKIYAQAFSEAIAKVSGKKQEEAYIANFLKKVFANGDRKSLNKILFSLEEILREKEGRQKFTLESARQLKPEYVNLFKKFFSKSDVLEQKTNLDLLAGVKILLNNKLQLDFSLARKLKELFKS